MFWKTQPIFSTLIVNKLKFEFEQGTMMYSLEVNNDETIYLINAHIKTIEVFLTHQTPIHFACKTLNHITWFYNLSWFCLDLKIIIKPSCDEQLVFDTPKTPWTLSSKTLKTPSLRLYLNKILWKAFCVNKEMFDNLHHFTCQDAMVKFSFFLVYHDSSYISQIVFLISNWQSCLKLHFVETHIHYCTSLER
jgi:hypothetical protein